MIVKAWNNGSHHSDGNGFGIKISIQDRDLYFDPSWKTITVELEDRNVPVEVNIDKASFWNTTCRELINKEIGKWLIDHHLDQWQYRQPPELELIKIGERKFLLKVLNQS